MNDTCSIHDGNIVERDSVHNSLSFCTLKKKVGKLVFIRISREKPTYNHKPNPLLRYKTCADGEHLLF